MGKKYEVYHNDLKFKSMRKINPDDVIWNHDSLKKSFHDDNFDTIEYRLIECAKSGYEYLDLSHLDLTVLPEFKNWKIYDAMCNIKLLFLNNNQLVNLADALKVFPSLEVLDLSHNMLESVDYIPPNVVELVCHNNKIKKMIQHKNLEKLDCSDNLLVKLESYPNLYNLLCHNNNLESIDRYENLYKLVCKNNPILNISNSPKLTYLDCSSTNLSGKSPHIPSVKYLICNCTKINDVSVYKSIESLEIIETAIQKIPYFETLKDLIFTDDDSLLLPSSYKIVNYVKEKKNSYLMFKTNS